jgi:hypothetical protein
MTLGVKPGDRWRVARDKAIADQVEADRIEHDAAYWKAVGVQGRNGDPGTAGEPGLPGEQGPPGIDGTTTVIEIPAPYAVTSTITFAANNLVSGCVDHLSDGTTRTRHIVRNVTGRPVSITTSDGAPAEPAPAWPMAGGHPTAGNA